METSSYSSTPSSPSKMPAEASNDESQALQLRKATEVLANMSVSKRNPAASASQDSQLIKPGQQVLDNEGSQSQTPQEPTEQGLSKIALTEIDDQIQMVEKKVVVIAILAEKKTMVTAMLSGARDIPRELRITRELPGLAPWCKYSASTRLQVEELTKKQNNSFLQLVLAELKDHVMVEAEWDLAEALVTAKRKLIHTFQNLSSSKHASCSTRSM